MNKSYSGSEDPLNEQKVLTHPLADLAPFPLRHDPVPMYGSMDLYTLQTEQMYGIKKVLYVPMHHSCCWKDSPCPFLPFFQIKLSVVKLLPLQKLKTSSWKRPKWEGKSHKYPSWTTNTPVLKCSGLSCWQGRGKKVPFYHFLFESTNG